MNKVKAKKKFGQHFLKNSTIAKNIVDSLKANDVDYIVEVGPGMGVLTQFILQKDYKSFFIEIDKEATDYLQSKFQGIDKQIINQDFLKIDLKAEFHGRLAIIGNFPYNISSQILFKVLENKINVTELVGMFQKEVADRVLAGPGSKVYGILSVLVKAYYDTEKLMELGPENFSPPPKVKSSVIRLKRNDVKNLDCDENLFFKIVKTTFNQRRKMIRNTIKSFGVGENFKSDYLTQRPEQLSVADFIVLTQEIEMNLNSIER